MSIFTLGQLCQGRPVCTVTPNFIKSKSFVYKMLIGVKIGGLTPRVAPQVLPINTCFNNYSIMEPNFQFKE